MLKKIMTMVLLFAFSLQAESEKTTLIIGDVRKGIGADSIPAYKFNQAMLLAVTAADNYELIPESKTDSLYDISKDNEMSIMEAAMKLDADKIIFGRLDRLHNIIRVDIKMVDPHDSTINNGTGYDLLNFVDVERDERMIDPGILAAAQRAFAQATGDTNMYADAPGTMRVFPADPLVVAGLGFIGQPDTTMWDIYNSREVNSFSVVESIFEAASRSDNYVVYDTDTRDSVYALFNMYGIENYMAPTTYEVEALRKMQVKYFISGSIQFFDDRAEINIILFEIKPVGQKRIAGVEGELRKDSISALNKKIKQLTYELLNIPEEKRKKE